MIQVSINTPQPGEGFRFEMRGRHAGELQAFFKDILADVPACPDGHPTACTSCLAWAITNGLLDERTL